MTAARNAAAGAAPAQPFDYRFACEVPEDFVPLPRAGTDEEWREALRELLPKAEEDALHLAAAALQEALARLTPENTVRTALCVGHRDDTLVLGFLSVSVAHTGHRNDLVAAETVYRTLRQDLIGSGDGAAVTPIDRPRAKGVQGPQDTILAVRLPCGPAVSLTSLRAMVLPRPPGAQAEVRVGVANQQLIVPAPDTWSLYVTLFTPTLAHVDLFGAQLAAIGRTVTFDVPSPAAPGQDGKHD
ncbi:hypothetical protein RM780_22030 [Streptomyces sp. DSM 44917]|uniref:ESX secretion-associated protein EspG n=1 Tax=Streptomyces boetiae TaxID=3075541 RepID=A0ABU2LDG1_9ACTN|nr:hypothetical protein [Streptomyces sp. DSM 44917]MDT0309616.1 hypothetical protein [Streptomyces sp. DSM 44917]